MEKIRAFNYLVVYGFYVRFDYATYIYMFICLVGVYEMMVWVRELT